MQCLNKLVRMNADFDFIIIALDLDGDGLITSSLPLLSFPVLSSSLFFSILPFAFRFQLSFSFRAFPISSWLPFLLFSLLLTFLSTERPRRQQNRILDQMLVSCHLSLYIYIYLSVSFFLFLSFSVALPL